MFVQLWMVRYIYLENALPSKILNIEIFSTFHDVQKRIVFLIFILYSAVLNYD